jgi:hypothetical protein
MEEILQIVSIYFDKMGNLVVKAYLDGCGEQTVKQTRFDPPEYGPGLCEAIIDSEFLPPEVHQNLTEKELEQLIDRYELLQNQNWYKISEDYSDVEFDKYLSFCS